MLKRTLLITLTLASSALATKTQFFKHADRAAFESGTLDGLVATNFGELRLARALDTVPKDEGKYASIDAMAEGQDGAIYLGTTASGKLLMLKDGKTAELADFGEASGIGAIVVDAGGDVIFGVSGERAEVQVLHKGQTKPTRLIQLPEGTQYIWSIALAADGKIYLGTGPDGQLFEITADGRQSKVIFDSDEDNLRALAILNDTIFVGTDPHGLVLKVDRTTGKAFVIYDAPETEVSSLLVDPRGGQIYAGTSQLVETPGEAAATTEPTGRPNGNDAMDHLKPDAGEAPAKPTGDAGDGALQASPATPQMRSEAAADGPASRPANASPVATSIAGPKPTTDSATPADGAEAAANGNAVYRIEPQGFVSEVFRDNAIVYALARQNDQLFIATGPAGAVYQLDLTSEEHFAIAKVRPTQVTSILSTADNRLLIGTGGGSAEAYSLTSSLAKTGTFVSPVLDANAVSAFGKVQVIGAVPEKAKLTVSTRCGNVAEEDSPLWSEWSAPVPAARYADVVTAAARYVQYKLAFSGDGSGTPTVNAVELAYVQPNVAPRIESVTVADAAPTTDETTGETSPNAHRTIQWTTTDPNGDEMRFNVWVRDSAASPWTMIAKEIKEASYDWDTRRVADGRYEVKVEASDALANAPGTGKTASRVAEAITVDNTPPTIGDVKIDHAGGRATILFRAADKASTIAKLEYAVDDQQTWQTVQPSDMLNDSPDEQYAIVLPDAAGGATRVISLRCLDENGNTAHESVTVRPEK